MRALWFLGVFAASLALVAGCSRGSTSTGGGPKAPLEVTLTEGGVDDIYKAAKDTKNAVVLVEFWTMATEPPADLALETNSRAGDSQLKAPSMSKDKVAWHGVRKAEFMATKYEGYFLRTILVNVDGPEKKDEVLKFLKDRDARHVTNFIWKGDPAAAAQRYGFTGKAPHQVLFARNGSRVWATGEPLPKTLDSLIFDELDKK